MEVETGYEPPLQINAKAFSIKTTRSVRRPKPARVEEPLLPYLPCVHVLVCIDNCYSIDGLFYLQVFVEPEDLRATPTRKYLRESQNYRGIITVPFVHEVKLLEGEILKIQVRAAGSRELLGEICDERRTLEPKYLSYQYFTDREWLDCLEKSLSLEGDKGDLEGRQRGMYLIRKDDNSSYLRKKLQAIGLENRDLHIALQANKHKSGLDISFYAQYPKSETLEQLCEFYQFTIPTALPDHIISRLSLILNRPGSKVDTADFQNLYKKLTHRTAPKTQRSNEGENVAITAPADAGTEVPELRYFIKELRFEERAEEKSYILKMLQSLKERSMNIDLPQLTQKFKADLSELINLLDIKLKDRSNFSLVKFNQTPIDTNKWCNFMIFVQGEKELSLENLKGQLKRYSSKFFHSTEENEYQWEATTKFTIRMFWNYLFDPIQNSIASPPKNEENLDGPLKDYWIDSSHNTYLPGDQLSSDTTTEMYRIALLRGCRCLELDVWSSDNELVVHHGFTITKKIPLADCLKTIRDYAFKVSDLPLILSFEFHISFDSKREVAKICETTFGDMLQTTDSYPYKGGVVSPQTLKRKILMKFHKNKRVVEDKDSHVSNGWKLFRKGDFSKAIQLATKNVPEEQVELDPIDEDDPLERFACIPGGLDAPHGVESAPEEKLSSLLRLANQKLIRIYPRATRTDSSNFNPISAWVNGYQMAAMNYQSDGFPMWLNDAKFSAKKYGGWIRKPDIIKKHNPKRLRITVISGWRLPAPWKSVDTVETHSLVQAGVLSLHKVEEVLPQVEVSLWDDLTPTVEQERLTNPPSTDILLYRTIICSDAFNPLFWKDGTGVHVSAGCFRPSSTPMDEGEPGPFEFEIKNEDFETIVFRVIDRNILSESQNDVIGYFAIRVADMRNGFRVVPLKGEMGTPLLHGSLLVYVEYPAPDVVELESQKTTRTKKKDMVISETTSLKKGDYILLEDND